MITMLDRCKNLKRILEEKKSSKNIWKGNIVIDQFFLVAAATISSSYDINTCLSISSNDNPVIFSSLIIII